MLMQNEIKERQRPVTVQLSLDDSSDSEVGSGHRSSMEMDFPELFSPRVTAEQFQSDLQLEEVFSLQALD